jgi:hypothetical protein
VPLHRLRALEPALRDPSAAPDRAARAAAHAGGAAAAVGRPAPPQRTRMARLPCDHRRPTSIVAAMLVETPAARVGLESVRVGIGAISRDRRRCTGMAVPARRSVSAGVTGVGTAPHQLIVEPVMSTRSAAEKARRRAVTNRGALFPSSWQPAIADAIRSVTPLSRFRGSDPSSLPNAEAIMGETVGEVGEDLLGNS